MDVQSMTAPVAAERTGKTLQDFLRGGSGFGLRHVRELVAPAEYEATAILEQLEDDGATDPILFGQVQSLDGDDHGFRVLFNAYGTLASVAAALGLPDTSWLDLTRAYPGKVAQLRPAQAVERASLDRHVQEVTRAGDAVDLRVLPWIRHVTMDGGPYFTPIVVARDPRGSRYNLSWNRAMYLDERHVGVHISPKDLWRYHRAVEERGESLPVALVIGHHPAFHLAAAAIGDADTDEYHIAGALLGEPVRTIPSVAYGKDLMVPADAEILVEGRLLGDTRVVEGPFGEYMRYVGPQKLSHVLEVDAVTWRRDPVALGIFTCHADHLNAHISLEASLYERARQAVPQVTRVSWLRGGGPTTLVIAMRKSSEGQPMRAAMAAMAAQNILKQVIVVDDDIDVDDSHEVLWAVSTRVRTDEDITILKGLQGITLDPSGMGHGKMTGMVIDATWPLHRPHPPVGRVPEDAIERFPLSNYRIEES